MNKPKAKRDGNRSATYDTKGKVMDSLRTAGQRFMTPKPKPAPRSAVGAVRG